MRKVLARDGKILVRDRKIATGIDTSCCAGCGGTGGPCSCFSANFRACPGDAAAFCCSAKQFDVITTVRCATLTTIDPSAWGLPLFGYSPVSSPVPSDGVLLDGYWEYVNTLSVRCIDGNQSIAQVGTFRWGVEWYVGNVDNNVSNGERSWSIPPGDSGARTVPTGYGNAVDFDPMIGGVFPSEVGAADSALDALYPPLLATISDCVESYGVGSLATSRVPYVFVPPNFAYGGAQVTGSGTTSSDCTYRTSSMRFNWSFLGAGGVAYGSSSQEWDMSDQTIVYEECDADPCGG